MALFDRRPEASSKTNCVENALLLRKDVHTLWDRHKFCIIPKAGRWVVHVIDNATTRELEETYHKIPLQLLLQVSPTYLLARFALSIFAAKPAFIKLALRPRRVVKVDENNQKSVQTLPSSQCRLELKRPKPQSQYPSRSPKRLRDWEAEQWGDDLWDQPQYDSGDLGEDDEAEEEEDEEDRRGRPRKRRLHLGRYSASLPSPCSTGTCVTSKVSDGSLKSSFKGPMDPVPDELEEGATL